MAKKLMEEIQDALRVQNYALKTEQQYMNWIRRYVLATPRPTQASIKDAFILEPFIT